MVHPVKKITYQDLHKLNDSLQQLNNWHEKFSLIKNSSTISDEFFYEHERILKTLDEEVQGLKRKPKLKNIWI